MKRILLLAAVVGIGFTACKKEESGSGSPGNQTTEEKIIGIWMGDEQVISIVAPPPIGTQTQTEDLSYLNVEFKSDGTAVADSAGFDPEPLTWSLTGNNQINIDSETFDIIKLDASSFHFGYSETDSIGGVPVQSEIIIKLKK
jgi:hypothetical protein